MAAAVKTKKIRNEVNNLLISHSSCALRMRDVTSHKIQNLSVGLDVKKIKKRQKIKNVKKINNLSFKSLRIFLHEHLCYTTFRY